MLDKIQTDTFEKPLHALAEPLQSRVYFFHDVRVTCLTNSLPLLKSMDALLGLFSEPERCAGDLTCYLLCYEQASDFPMQLPPERVRTETVKLLPGTRLKYYMSRDGLYEYQSYVEFSGVNGNALTALGRANGTVVVQLAKPEQFQPSFLRRYLLLLALGRGVDQSGFKPCHAAAITAPGDDRQGALIIGASGSGKTTLSLGCAAAGCGFLGDDLVMLREENATGTIQAYSISHEVAVRTPSLALSEQFHFLHSYPVDARDKRYCSIEQVRQGSGRMKTAVRLLLFPALIEEGPSRVVRLSKASTLQALVEQCLRKAQAQAESQEQLFLLVSRMAEQATGYRLEIARNDTNGPHIVRSLFTDSEGS